MAMLADTGSRGPQTSCTPSYPGHNLIQGVCMAFFDFDSKLQKLLIFGALCAITALPCGCRYEDYPTTCDDPGPDLYDPYWDSTEDLDGDEAVPDIPEDADEPDPDKEDILDVTEDADEPDPDEDDALEDAEDVVEEDVATDEEDATDEGDDAVASKTGPDSHGFVRGEIIASATRHGGIRLLFVTPTLQEARTSFGWSTSSGAIEPDGATAVWYPENEAGVHAVQAVARCDGIICLEVYRIRVPG